MSAAMEAFCIRLRPPEPPIFASTPLEAKNRIRFVRTVQHFWSMKVSDCIIYILVTCQKQKTYSHLVLLKQGKPNYSNVETSFSKHFLWYYIYLQAKVEIGSSVL